VIFMDEQLERFKKIAQRALRDIEEWPKMQDIQVQKIEEEIRRAFSEGYYTAMYEVSSSPWEMMKVALYRDTGRGTHEGAMDVVDGRLAEGWEPWQVCGPDGRYLLMRRHRAIASIEAKSKTD